MPSVALPEKWSWCDGTPVACRNVREARGPAGSFGVEPSLILSEAPHPGIPLGKWLRNTLKEIERDLPSLHVIDVAQTRLGDVAADVIWATRSLTVNLTQVEYLILTERSGIILLFTCSSADFAALNEEFARCAQSLATENGKLEAKDGKPAAEEWKSEAKQ